MQLLRRRYEPDGSPRALALAGLLALALALPGCGGGDKSKQNTVPSQPSTTPAVPTTTNPAPPSTSSTPSPTPQTGTQPDNGTGGTQAPGGPSPGPSSQGGSDGQTPSQRYQEFCKNNPSSCAD
jgi:hypothetical protein